MKIKRFLSFFVCPAFLITIISCSALGNYADGTISFTFDINTITPALARAAEESEEHLDYPKISMKINLYSADYSVTESLDFTDEEIKKAFAITADGTDASDYGSHSLTFEKVPYNTPLIARGIIVFSYSYADQEEGKSVSFYGETEPVILTQEDLQLPLKLKSISDKEKVAKGEYCVYYNLDSNCNFFGVEDGFYYVSKDGCQCSLGLFKVAEKDKFGNPKVLELTEKCSYDSDANEYVFSDAETVKLDSSDGTITYKLADGTVVQLTQSVTSVADDTITVDIEESEEDGLSIESLELVGSKLVAKVVDGSVPEKITVIWIVDGIKVGGADDTSLRSFEFDISGYSNDLGKHDVTFEVLFDGEIYSKKFELTIE